MKKFIISRKEISTNSEDEMNNILRYVMWKKREYTLNKGDIIYWYDRKEEILKWKTEIVDIDVYHYDEKSKMVNHLKNYYQINDDNEITDNDYFREKDDSPRWCISFRVKVINSFKPIKNKISFPTQYGIITENSNCWDLYNPET